MITEKTLQTFNEVYAQIEKGMVTPDKVETFLKWVLEFVTKRNSEYDTLSKANLKTLADSIVTMKEEYKKTYEQIKENSDSTKEYLAERFDLKIAEVQALVDELYTIEIHQGVDADEEKVIQAVYKKLVKKIEKPKETTAKQERDKLETLEGEERLDVSAVKGVEELIEKKVKSQAPKGGARLNTVGGGVQSIISSDGSVTVTSSGAKGKGVVDLSISGGTGGVNFETPVGVIDSSNVTYTVTNTPKAVILNGLMYFEGDGYTLAGLTITMLVVPFTGSTLRSMY